MVSKNRSRMLLVGGAALALSACGKSETAAPAPAIPAAFASCATCHSIDAKGGNRVGPNLHGVVGRKAGALPAYRYSAAMRDSTIVWSAETLDRFLAAPQQTLPGSRMVQSESDAVRRREIITYLTSLTPAN